MEELNFSVSTHSFEEELNSLKLKWVEEAILHYKRAQFVVGKPSLKEQEEEIRQYLSKLFSFKLSVDIVDKNDIRIGTSIKVEKEYFLHTKVDLSGTVRI